MPDYEILEPKQTKQEMNFLEAVKAGSVRTVADMMRKLKKNSQFEPAADMLLRLIESRDENIVAEDLKEASEIDLKDTSDEYEPGDLGSILGIAPTNFPHTVHRVVYRLLMNLKPEEETPQLVDALFNILERDGLQERFPANLGWSVIASIEYRGLCSPEITRRLFETYFGHEDDKIGKYALRGLEKIYGEVAVADALGYDISEYHAILMDAVSRMGYEFETYKQLTEGNTEDKKITALVRIAKTKPMLVLPAELPDEPDDFAIHGIDGKGTLRGDAVYVQPMKNGEPMDGWSHMHLKGGVIEKWENECPGSAEKHIKELAIALRKHSFDRITGKLNPIKRYTKPKTAKSTPKQ